MLLNILQYFLISFILILLIHYLYNFFKNNLTVPKVKDLIYKPKKRYEEIYESIETNEKEEIDTESMKNELKNYLSELNEKNVNKNDESQNISSFSNDTDANYSTY
jgi:hypothetical protein